MTNLSKLVQRRVGDMAHSLLTEDYRIMVNVTLPGSYFVKLRHKCNGNLITIVGSYSTGLIRLMRNGKVRHRETVSE